ncbi:MAG: porin family protein [Treponema sp.]|jgi:hypothetical protein|nr:porin family protein [Treponema sp.]
MKKTVVVALFLTVLGTTVFALDKAAGGGLLLGGTFQGGSESVLGYDADWTYNRTSFGAFGFFGLSQYVEFNLGFLYKAGEGTVSTKYDKFDLEIDPTTALQLGAYGKYPFPISDKFVVFPTAGMDVELTLSDENWWSDLWIRAGAGVDYFFTDALFLRGHFIYGVAIPFNEQDVHPDVGHGFLVKVGVGYMF